LGFYFDRKLSFKEHVQYYSMKALTMVQAMGMLGNSNRGLLPMQKHLLYRMCVLPVATYGYRLWYHDRAKVKGLMSSLSKMQWQAAFWIIGMFRTSPTGGCEAIAGLIPTSFSSNHHHQPLYSHPVSFWQHFLGFTGSY
jgi:hypothetical protein